MPLTKTFHGFIENATDTLLIIEACRTGILPTVNRRLIERERSSIKSGTIIVFDENESGIKRWTDGFLWSPSRILGDFLVYRELENKDNRRQDIRTLTSYHDNINMEGENSDNLELQQERALVGSLTTSNTSYNFKKGGLIKKTIRVLVNGNYLHIINYYNKNDVLSHLLPVPSKSQQLSCLTISSDLIPHLNGCNTNTYGIRQKNSRRWW
ncbi:hypothetical protein K501DRAFT_281427 [Backusella circina FSU 941]|nr:hypothetical protein K501DRAFT_281427 [Backusella circina FSU 941]